MELKIYGKEEKNKDVYLKLDKIGEVIMLVACNEHGNTYPQGHLLSVSRDGVKFQENINSTLGFDLSPLSRKLRVF